MEVFSDLSSASDFPGSPLKCIRAYPTLKDQGKRLRGVGFVTGEAQTMTTFYRELLDNVER